MSGYAAALERVSRVRGVRGALLAGLRDGIVVAETVMEGVDGRALAALAAGLASRFERAAGVAGVAAPHLLHLRGENGALLAVPAPGELLLVALADPDADLGLARLELREAAARLG